MGCRRNEGLTYRIETSSMSHARKILMCRGYSWLVWWNLLGVFIPGIIPDLSSSECISISDCQFLRCLFFKRGNGRNDVSSFSEAFSHSQVSCETPVLMACLVCIYKISCIGSWAVLLSPFRTTPFRNIHWYSTSQCIPVSKNKNKINIVIINPTVLDAWGSWSTLQSVWT